MKKNGVLKALGITFVIYVVLSWIIPVGYYSNGSFTTKTIEPIGIFDIVKYPIVTLTSSVFVLTSVGNATLLRFLTVKNYFEIKPILADVGAVLLIAAFGYFFKPKHTFYFIILTQKNVFHHTFHYFLNFLTFYNNSVDFSIIL